MNERVNTFKNFAIAGLSFAAGCVVKKCLGKIIDKKVGEIFGDQVEESVAEKLNKWLFGISGKTATKEIDRIKANFMKRWMFKGKNLDELNLDVTKLSEAALKLSIEEGIWKPYKKELDERKEVASDLKKRYKDEVDDEIKRLQKELSKSWKFSDDDIIKYVDFTGNYSDSPLEEMLSEIKIPDICKSFSFNDYFKRNFQKAYQIYFGELLKSPEYSKALIAYQREVQKMMMEAIRQKENGLRDEEIEKISEAIQRIATEGIKDAINDAVDQSLKDITIRLDEIRDDIKKYIKDNTLVIEAVRGDDLWVTLKCGETEIVSNNLEELKNRMKGALFFKYKNDIYYIDDNEEAFDYITGKIKQSYILIHGLCQLMKELDPKLPKLLKIGIYNWKTDDPFFRNCRDAIVNNLLCIIIPNIMSLCAMDDIDKSKQKKDYVAKCFLIVKRIIDLSFFICLTYIQEGKIMVDKKIKKEIGNLLEIKNYEEEIIVLYQLLNIQYNNDDLLRKFIEIKDYFGNDGKLSDVFKEFNKFEKSDLNMFDCYRAEKMLTEFLVYFAFLTNYNMTSMRGIEYHNIKRTAHAYIQYRQPISHSQEKNNKIVDKETFTNTVLLVDKKYENRNINLYPFVIDRTALKKNSKYLEPVIAFFSYYIENKLSYEILQYNPKSDEENKYKCPEWKNEDISEDADKYSDDNIEKYNINCVLKSFEEIKKELTS